MYEVNCPLKLKILLRPSRKCILVVGSDLPLLCQGLQLSVHAQAVWWISEKLQTAPLKTCEIVAFSKYHEFCFHSHQFGELMTTVTFWEVKGVVFLRKLYARGSKLGKMSWRNEDVTSWRHLSATLQKLCNCAAFKIHCSLVVSLFWYIVSYIILFVFTSRMLIRHLLVDPW